MMETVFIAWQVIAIIAAVVGAAIWIRSTLVKQRHKELEDLVDTRGAKISDLQIEVDDLRRQVAELRGQLTTLTELKTQQIAAATAEQVVDSLLPFLQGK